MSETILALTKFNLPIQHCMIIKVQLTTSKWKGCILNNIFFTMLLQQHRNKAPFKHFNFTNSTTQTYSQSRSMKQFSYQKYYLLCTFNYVCLPFNYACLSFNYACLSFNYVSLSFNFACLSFNFYFLSCSSGCLSLNYYFLSCNYACLSFNYYYLLSFIYACLHVIQL